MGRWVFLRSECLPHFAIHNRNCKRAAPRAQQNGHASGSKTASKGAMKQTLRRCVELRLNKARKVQYPIGELATLFLCSLRAPLARTRSFAADRPEQPLLRDQTLRPKHRVTRPTRGTSESLRCAPINSKQLVFSTTLPCLLAKISKI